MYFLVERFQHNDHSVHHGIGLKHLHLIAYAEWQVGADKVHDEHIVLNVVQGKLRLIGYVLILMNVFNSLGTKVFDGRAPRFVASVGHLLR